MAKLKINQETAINLFPEAPGWFQKILNESFGEETFKPLDWHDIKTFEDACKVIGTTEQEFNEKFKATGLGIDTIAYEKLKIIVATINRGWMPDWTNSNQCKYYPYFTLSSGSGFSGRGCVFSYSSSHVGSRLCFESREKCLYAANQFTDIYKDFFTINN